jgi:hypothetical protein
VGLHLADEPQHQIGFDASDHWKAPGVSGTCSHYGQALIGGVDYPAQGDLKYHGCFPETLTYLARRLHSWFPSQQSVHGVE